MRLPCKPGAHAMSNLCRLCIISSRYYKLRSGGAVFFGPFQGLSSGSSDLSLHPPRSPFVTQVVAVGFIVSITVVIVVVEYSLQPKKPGVRHVVLVSVLVVVTGMLVVEEGIVVVVASRQPHHPGVLHVSVRVCVKVEEAALDLVVVVVPLLS
jgi:hypothetical protein